MATHDPKRNRMTRRYLVASLFLALLVVACGDLAAVSQGRTLDRLEQIQDPAGFERIGDIELIDEETGIRVHQGGYRLTWQADDASPQQIVDVFVPLLREVDYGVEPWEGTVCSSDSVRLFFIHEPNLVGSARLTFDESDRVVQLTAGWDARTRAPDADPLGETPSCEGGDQG